MRVELLYEELSLSCDMLLGKILEVSRISATQRCGSRDIKQDRGRYVDWPDIHLFKTQPKVAVMRR